LNPSEATPAAPRVAPAPVANVIPRSEHSISRNHISQNALRVLYRLRDGGFQAFLVGGCVRDLLLGLEPKDFDVVTDALPEQVKRLFRNCRLVGRRFRLAHVFFGREIIEVATFRAATAPEQGEEPLPDADPEDGEAPEVDAAPPEVEPEFADDDPDRDRLVDEEGRILRDNIYGSIAEDVWRRDFTANALYYNIADFSVWDYVDGARDVAARQLRLIGDPDTRYREDPVRMLRGARFEAKLDFEIEPNSREPLERHAPLIANVPPARLFDETLKLFLTGHGVRSLEVLRRHGLLAHLFPTVDAYLVAHPGSLVEKLLLQGLTNTDERVRADKPVTPTFFFALLFYGPIAKAIEAMPPERWHDLRTILDACERAVREGQTHVVIPKRFTLGVREMFALQPRLEHPRGRRALRVLEHPKFRAAYDLLLLRAKFGLASPDMARWWTQLQEASPEARDKMLDALVPGAGPRKEGGRRGGRHRRRRRSSRPAE
jgi:poly(A) polymerase